VKQAQAVRRGVAVEDTVGDRLDTLPSLESVEAMTDEQKMNATRVAIERALDLASLLSQSDDRDALIDRLSGALNIATN
jgi:hypothetical protein